MRLFTLSRRLPAAPSQRKAAETVHSVVETVEDLDLAALRKLRDRVDSRMAILEENNSAATLDAVDNLINQSGIDRTCVIAHLRGRADAPRSRPVNGTTFVHPETGESWKGRGRKPNWLKAFENSGGRLQDIKTNPDAPQPSC